MGLETATYIGQLVATNPTAADPVSQGDDHLRLIKSVLQSQFTALGNAAVTVTAAQLNAVTSKLVSFNGRTATAVVPTEGDYTLELLGDVDLTSPTLGQVMMYNGAGNWVNIRGGAILTSGVFLYDTYASKVTDSIYFTNERRNTIPASIGTIKNDGTGGIGWTFTAAAACLVQLNYQQSNTSGVAQASALGITFSPSSPSASFPSASNNRLAYQTGSVGDEAQCCSASTILAAGDVLTVYATGTSTGHTLSGIAIML